MNRGRVHLEYQLHRLQDRFLFVGKAITSAHSLNGSWLGLGLVLTAAPHSLYNDSRQLE